MFKKGKKNKEEKVNMKKSTVIIIEVIVAVVVLLVALGIKFLVTNKENKNIVRLEDQLIENISFTDFILEYKEGKSVIDVTLINYTEEPIDVNKLTIKLYAKDNSKVSEIEIPFPDLTGRLETNQRTQAHNETEMDLRGISKVEYIVE